MFLDSECLGKTNGYPLDTPTCPQVGQWVSCAASQIPSRSSVGHRRKGTKTWGWPGVKTLSKQTWLSMKLNRSRVQIRNMMRCASNVTWSAWSCSTQLRYAAIIDFVWAFFWRSWASVMKCSIDCPRIYRVVSLKIQHHYVKRVLID